MRSRMAAIDSLNSHYQPFSIDSVSEMADYFESHGTPHDRITAYYLLGSAFRDAGEAPAALKVEDSAGSGQPTYYGAFHFNDGADSDLEYSYDWNGNVTRDLNKGITEIKYNCLNLPSKITFSDGSTAVYTYSATGEKLGVRHVTASSNVYEAYCDNFIYRAGSLKRVLVDGGYITLSGGTKYHYYLKDHLGNNRMVVRADGTVEQVTHYYPYGGLMGESTGGDTQPYKYNGKELDRTNGLDWYDYGARHMDAALGRFTTMDPLCEKYYSISPYADCAGNPVNAIDIHGDSISFWSLIEYDKIIGANYSENIVGDLKSQTGLNLYFDNGQLRYQMDDRGEPIVNTGVSVDGQTYQLGSETARSLLISGIDNEQMVEVGPGRITGVPHGSNNIGINVKQVSSFIVGTHNMDNRTLGWGMTFMHEFLHTNVGGSYNDTDISWQTGSVVNTMNIIRMELNEKGGDYGIRMQYQAVPIHSKAYIPFDKASAAFVRTGFVPFTKFICF